VLHYVGLAVGLLGASIRMWWTYRIHYIRGYSAQVHTATDSATGRRMTTEESFDDGGVIRRRDLLSCSILEVKASVSTRPAAACPGSVATHAGWSECAPVPDPRIPARNGQQRQGICCSSSIPASLAHYGCYTQGYRVWLHTVCNAIPGHTAYLEYSSRRHTYGIVGQHAVPRGRHPVCDMSGQCHHYRDRYRIPHTDSGSGIAYRNGLRCRTLRYAGMLPLSGMLPTRAYARG